MSTTYDRDRPVNLRAVPLAIAFQRSARLADPIARARFMDAFTKGRVAEARGDGRMYQWFRSALEADDSITVAGLIEGAASVHGQQGLVF